MLIKRKTLIRAREIANNLSQGINPLNEMPIKDAEFLNDPKMIRYFSFVSEVLTNNIEGNLYERPSKRKRFFILPEEVDKISLPEGDITISIFVEAVNNAVDLGNRKGLTASKINSQLKKMGILKTVILTDGKKETRITDTGESAGVREDEIEREGRNYFRISYNDDGKQFLLNNLIDILNYSDGTT